MDKPASLLPLPLLCKEATVLLHWVCVVSGEMGQWGSNICHLGGSVVSNLWPTYNSSVCFHCRETGETETVVNKAHVFKHTH